MSLERIASLEKTRVKINTFTQREIDEIKNLIWLHFNDENSSSYFKNNLSQTESKQLEHYLNAKSKNAKSEEFGSLKSHLAQDFDEEISFLKRES
jgi:hypothetical protein